jgi:hypothetical protein
MLLGGGLVLAASTYVAVTGGGESNVYVPYGAEADGAKARESFENAACASEGEGLCVCMCRCRGCECRCRCIVHRACP